MDIKNIKGIGPVLEKKFRKIGINTTEDLLNFYPYRYNIYNIVDINDVKGEENCMIKVTVVESPKISYIKRNFNRLSFKAVCNNIIVNVVIFNRAFIKNNIIPGKEILLIGKYNKLKASFTASDIKFSFENNKIEPVYHLYEGMKNSNVIKVMEEALKYNEYYDNIPNKIIEKYNFISKEEALRCIHIPKSIDDIDKAKKRLKYEELFEYMFKINYLKRLNNKIVGIKRSISDSSINEFMNNLPFNLTNDQILAIKDIHNDLLDKKRMNRLILGDVGSGKTIVATYAVYLNFLSGFQSALMAPTEILAEQHYLGLKKVLNKFNINMALLTGSMKLKEKKEVITGLKNGDIDLIIGTHALISEEVEFNNLGLVITDEQHRFGVDQRNILKNKNNIADALYLSATPIPRTYAISIYGDLDLSIIKSKPFGRLSIKTKVIREKDFKEVLHKMLEELKSNHQIYIVAPLITNEDGESNLSSVIDLKERIDTAFNHLVPIEILHGKIKQDEKDIIMDDFKNNKVKILISTTVIEVGIDVANATMMVIYNAERFGLATLHQLRGRVGRSSLQSYCYLVCSEMKERLKVLEESNDGFYITEKDFEMRGPGDMFGERQSGELEFKIADIKSDLNILLDAKKDSEEYIENGLLSDYYKNIIEDISIIN